MVVVSKEYSPKVYDSLADDVVVVAKSLTKEQIKGLGSIILS